MITTRNKAKLVHLLPIASATLLAGISCSTPKESDTTEAARLGTATSSLGGPSTFSTSLLPVIVNVGGCSGTIVGPRHVLTASHCFPRTADNWQGAQIASLTATYPNPANPAATVFVGNVVGILSYLSSDAVITLLDRDTGIEPVRVLDEPIDTWVGRRVFSSGYGSVASGSNGAWLTITSLLSDNRMYSLGTSTENYVCGGDSGGPDFVSLQGRWYVAGIHKAGTCGPTGSLSTRLDRGVATWIRSIVPVRDSMQWDAGRSYFVALNTAAGTSVLGQTTLGLSPYSASLASQKLSVGRVETALADFDGDGIDDVLALTPRRFTVYKSANFSATPWYDWNGDPGGTGQATAGVEQLGFGSMAIADFNGDNRADILRTDVNGTRLILSNGTTFVDAPVLPADVSNSRIYETTVTAADFNGDGIADAMMQDATGARFYFGQSGTAGLSALKGLNTSMKRGAAHVTPGRFTSTFKRDLIVATTTGTTLWVSSATASSITMTSAWTRTDLKANETAYHAGDTNGDGLDDLIISNPSGSYLYQATGNSANPWIANTWSNAAVTIETTDFHFANFDNTSYTRANGDGKADLWIIRPEGSYGYKGAASGLIGNYFVAPQ
jgi:Trypsin/FG-GAP-like repeat